MALRSRREMPRQTPDRPLPRQTYARLPRGTVLTKTTTYPKARTYAGEMGGGVDVGWQQRSWLLPDACPACGLLLSAGEKVVREETWGEYGRDRYRWWHHMCHPTVVDRYIAKARKEWAKKGIT